MSSGRCLGFSFFVLDRNLLPPEALEKREAKGREALTDRRVPTIDVLLERGMKKRKVYSTDGVKLYFFSSSGESAFYA